MSRRTLLLMRHAKSDWTNECDDHDRPLNARGLEAAPHMGRWLRDHELAPDCVLSSTANRARTTATLVAEAQDVKPDVAHLKSLYLPGFDDIASAVAQAPEEARCLLVVGHNPGFEHAVAAITSSRESMPTAAVAVIDIDLDEWSDVLVEFRGELRALLRVKHLPDQIA